MDAKNWIELISLFIVLAGIGWGFVKTWTTFSLKLAQVEKEIEGMKKTELTNHEHSLAKIEESRRERREEINSLKNEIFNHIREIRNDNRTEHSEIKTSLTGVIKTLTEVATEIRLSRKVRIDHELEGE
jgi:hypothetical protein